MKVLIVDDSALMRRALSEILGEIAGVEIRTARNGAEALEQVKRWEPSVVTLDVNMPVMDGLTCLSHIMAEAPCPVVMVSSITSENSGPALEALSMGAVEVVEKPDGSVSRRIKEIGNDIRRVVKGAARARARARRTEVESRPRHETRPKLRARPQPKTRAAEPAARRAARSGASARYQTILLGVSTGGPSALEQILPRLPSDLEAPIVIAQHMPPAFTGSFAARLNAASELTVCEVSKVTPLEPGHAYVINGGYDGVLEKRLGRVVLKPVPIDANYYWHPSVERLVLSALEVLDAERTMGVLLTGMGNDGAKAMAELHNQGGYTIAEAESSCVVYGMPRELIELKGADEIVDISSVAARIRATVQEE